LMMVVAVAMVTAYPNLPDISDLAAYKPKLPLRVLTDVQTVAMRLQRGAK